MRTDPARAALAVTAVCALTLSLAACSGGGKADSGHSGGPAKVADGGTFTFAMSSDPGKLDPQASAASNLYQASWLAYDSLVYADPDGSGKIVSGLADSWRMNGTKVTLTMHKGVTCSDGSAFTAADAAANLNYVADPKNKSPMLGVFLPTGTHAVADDATRTVTLTTPKPAPFILQGLAGIPIVCPAAMADRSMLVHKTDGTGPYTLTDVAPNDHYTYTKRKGYTWGPGGAGTAVKGMPDKIVIKIVENETTAANLLLTGQLTAATVTGADSERLTKAGLFVAKPSGMYGEMWFNEATGRPGSDRSVRLALTKALDLAQLRKVLTSGRGEPPNTLTNAPPAACPGTSARDALPTHDLAAAKQLLDQAGWHVGSDGIRSKDGKQLSLRFVYNTALGAGGSSAAELAVQQWRKLGVKVTPKPQDETATVQTAFSTGDWDILWEQVNLSSPDQLVPFVSGAEAPHGNNFAHIDNAAYEAGVAAAAKISGSAGCPKWLAAEAHLVSDADVVPFADKALTTFGNGATFKFLGDLIPTSIRMQAG